MSQEKKKEDRGSQDNILSELTLPNTYKENFLLGHHINNEIYMLGKKDVSLPEPIYSSVVPIYIDISKGKNNNKTPLAKKGKCNIYEMQVATVPKLGVGNQVQNAAKMETPAANNFLSISDIPKDRHNVTVNQGGQCLKLQNMNQYVEAFATTQVDGQPVYDLHPDMMKSSLGMDEFSVVKFLKFQDGWRPNVQK